MKCDFSHAELVSLDLGTLERLNKWDDAVAAHPGDGTLLEGQKAA